MRRRWVHGMGLTLSVLAVVACSGADDAEGGEGAGGKAMTSGGAEQNTGGVRSSDFDGGVPVVPRFDATVPIPPVTGTLTRIRIEPVNAELVVSSEQPASKDYKVFGIFEGKDGETDITDRAVFYVPENYLLGSFEQNGPTFNTNADLPHGGVATVAAIAANPDGSTVEVRTSLLIKIETRFDDPRDDGSSMYDVPQDADTLFGGADDPDRAPQLVYPNDGVLLPPNLNRFAVHFQPGDGNTLFQVRFESRLLSLQYVMRCGEPVDGGCLFELDETGYQMVAETNRGAGPVSIELSATDDSGSAVGHATSIKVQFAQDDVNGGLYYWSTTSPTSIMRFDFGVKDAMPETFLAQGQDGIPACVGCHAISPDGRKVVASLNGQGNGQQVLVNDLTVPRSDPSFLDRNGSDSSDRLQFASFNNDGSEFVAIWGDTGDVPTRNTLWFHDGDSGNRIAGREIQFDFEPDHPDWSADGNTIVMTRVGIHQTSQRPLNCGISLIRHDGNDWQAPETVIPVVDGDGKSRYNPDFVPDDAFFVFSESTCPNGDERDDDCDGDSDPSAKTWAAVAEANATAVLLSEAAAPGVMDGGNTNLSDTFPRGAPFRSTYLGPEQVLDGDVVRRPIYWVTVGSTRRIGLQNRRKGRQLWMFAVDPEKVLSGEDGSFPAFHLPFQDLATDNHIGQWTRTVVTDQPPPEPPVPPPPPVVPPPPLPELN